MSDLVSLAERVERGAEVKWLTADVDDLTRALIGPSWTLYDWGFADDAIRKNSLDASVALLERVLPGWFWSADSRHDSEAYVYRADRDVGSFWGRSKKPARAIVAAILRALATQEKRNG